MATKVVVLGAGYAGVGAVQQFEQEMGDGETEVTWISEHDYHLVLHEVHRVVRDPSVESKIALPIEDVKPPSTTFRQGRAVNVDVDDRIVELDDGETVDYDYLLIAVGSATAFYGIPGLEEYSHTLKGLDDARTIHEDIAAATENASRTDPARVVIGGAGLSGIQTAGEVAKLRDERRAPIDVTLVEGLDEVFPNNPASIQRALRKQLEAHDVNIMTGEFVSEVDDETIYVGGGEEEEPTELDYDVFVWTGGITGHEEIKDVDLDKDERSHRINARSDFTTSDDRVFAIGDTALVEQDDEVAPPTAQAAWQAAEVAGENLARAIRDEPLATWRHEDKGTVVSVGDAAVAHDVVGVPVETFGGLPAKMLKKAIAARWIKDASGFGDAWQAWSDM